MERSRLGIFNRVRCHLVSSAGRLCRLRCVVSKGCFFDVRGDIAEKRRHGVKRALFSNLTRSPIDDARRWHASRSPGRQSFDQCPRSLAQARVAPVKISVFGFRRPRCFQNQGVHANCGSQHHALTAYKPRSASSLDDGFSWPTVAQCRLVCKTMGVTTHLPD